MVNSKQKGARGEREWAKICREHGFEKARRSQQYAGGTEESADVTGLPYVHQEVKFGYDMTIEEIRTFLQQAIKDNGESNNLPIVAHKKTYGKWFVSMEWADFARMYTTAADEKISISDFQDNQIHYVTMPADDWFVLYKEYFAAMELERMGEKCLIAQQRMTR